MRAGMAVVQSSLSSVAGPDRARAGAASDELIN
jgi:hypothetical protein